MITPLVFDPILMKVFCLLHACQDVTCVNCKMVSVSGHVVIQSHTMTIVQTYGKNLRLNAEQSVKEHMVSISGDKHWLVIAKNKSAVQAAK